MSTTTIIMPGSSAMIGSDGDIPATVLAATIRPGNYVIYLVTWFDGRARKEEWLYPCEINQAKKQENISMIFGAIQEERADEKRQEKECHKLQEMLKEATNRLWGYACADGNELDQAFCKDAESMLEES